MTKTTDTTRTVEFAPTEPFKNLCKFIEWWTLNSKLVLKLDFQRKCWECRHVIDMTSSDWKDVLL